MPRIKQQYDEGKGNRIKNARIKFGFSRQRLANELASLSFSKDEYKNISGSLSAVKSWEGIGRKYSPDNTTLKAIAEILHVDFEWLLHGTTSDIVNSSRQILQNFNPNEWEMVSFDDSVFYYDGKPIPNEIIEKISVLYPLMQNGYSIDDVCNRKQFSEYMESSIRNSIEFYMKNLNEKEKEK